MIPVIGVDAIGVVANAVSTAVLLSPSSASLAENASTASAMELSIASLAADALGTNTMSLSGIDADSFEIMGNSLRLTWGVVLDFDMKSSYTAASHESGGWPGQH